MVDEFGARLEGLSAVLHVVDDPRAKALELIGGATVARWEDAILAGLGVDAEPAAADVSLIVADVGVVDTGAIGFVHGPGRSRAAGLLPDRQIALLARGDLVRSTAEALSRVFHAGVPPNVVFAAGPSRTADIEQKMMLGVHAPRSLDVILHP